MGAAHDGWPAAAVEITRVLATATGAVILAVLGLLPAEMALVALTSSATPGLLGVWRRLRRRKTATLPPQD